MKQDKKILISYIALRPSVWSRSSEREKLALFDKTQHYNAQLLARRLLKKQEAF